LLDAGKKLFLKVSTIDRMLKESRLKDQVSLFRHINEESASNIMVEKAPPE
jgi:hypothetical protein